MAKKKGENANTDTIIKVPVSKFIDTQFRSYALYVLESRGIPSFYDGLTNVQRYIIKNAPAKFSKTLTVVGACISDFYHHGDAALAKAIGRMARPFGNSAQLLEGYGFLGTEVSEQAAAPRYTSARLAPEIKEMVSKYDHLNTRDVEGPYHPFWLDYPIGLAIPIVGIAVGYKTTILPRKLEEVHKYINGNKRANLTPYFANFDGEIVKYNSEKSWYISSKLHIEGTIISVTNIPPVLKYTSVIKRLDSALSKYEGKFILLNNSKKSVDIKLQYRGKDASEFEDIKNIFKKVFSVIVTENIVFVKDGKVLEYDCIKDYLTDWRWQQARLNHKHSEHKLNTCIREIEYNKVKIEFIEFMLKTKRTVKEVNTFYSGHSDSISNRLDRLSPKHFTKEELVATAKLIEKLEKEKIELDKKYLEFLSVFEGTVDPTLDRGVTSKRTTMTLFDATDFKEVDGVMVWDADDAEDMLLDEMSDDAEDIS